MSYSSCDLPTSLNPCFQTEKEPKDYNDLFYINNPEAGYQGVVVVRHHVYDGDTRSTIDYASYQVNITSECKGNFSKGELKNMIIEDIADAIDREHGKFAEFPRLFKFGAAYTSVI